MTQGLDHSPLPWRLESRDLGAGERLGNQEHALRVARTEAGVGLLGRVADDDDGQPFTIWIAAR